MNNAILIGRMTKDPEVRYSDSGKVVCRFSVAVDRGKDKNGEDLGADFPGVVCFGKTAENCGKYLSKGLLVGVQGRIHTGKYEKDGKTVYTTDIYADRVEFLEWGDKEAKSQEAPEGFSRLDDEDIPF